jgi:hypothetical protein
MIKQISSNEFYKRVFKSTARRGSWLETVRRNWAEVEWWATRDFQKLGSVTFDNNDGTWNVVVVEVFKGQYHTCDVEPSLPTQKEASAVLQALLKGERKSKLQECQRIAATQLNGGVPPRSDEEARQIIFDLLNEPNPTQRL